MENTIKLWHFRDHIGLCPQNEVFLFYPLSLKALNNVVVKWCSLIPFSVTKKERLSAMRLLLLLLLLLLSSVFLFTRN